MGLDEDFAVLGITEQPGESTNLKTAKARLRRYLDQLCLTELLDRLYRQVTSLKD